MMGQPKPFASLSSGLLARKGQAKPAMRPQGFSGFGAVSDAIDDLGWNDMGVSEQPAVAPAVAAAASPADAVPTVLRQREVLKEEFEAPAPVAELPVAEPSVPAPAAMASVATPVARPPVVRAPAGSKAKAAFTLRLDHERHLRLRLASAMGNRSAQQIVTAALDSYLQTLPDLEAMAQQLSARALTDLDEGD